MDKKFNFQKLISGVGIAAIALVGSLIGAPASNAAASMTISDSTWDANTASPAVTLTLSGVSTANPIDTIVVEVLGSSWAQPGTCPAFASKSETWSVCRLASITNNGSAISSAWKVYDIDGGFRLASDFALGNYTGAFTAAGNLVISLDSGAFTVGGSNGNYSLKVSLLYNGGANVDSATTNIAVSGGTGGGGGGGSLLSAPSVAVSSGIATPTMATWSSGTPNPLWLFCTNSYSQQSGTTEQTSPPSDCGPIRLVVGGALISPVAGTPYTIPSSALKWTPGAVYVQTELGNLNVAVYESNGNSWVMSATVPVGGSVITPVTAEVVRLPEWQTKAINSITKVIDQSGVKLIGGKIKLDGVTASDLKKVTLNGKEISVESLNPEAPVLNIPAGAGTGDLVFTLANGGTWTFQNAVRYVEPIKAGKPMKLFNFDNGSTTVNSYQVAQIAAQTADLMRGSTVECFGYVAKKNANTVARATAQAEAICAEALKINPALKKVITIAVDEIMALQPNRIRVFG